MRRQLIGAILIAVLLGILIMVVVRCGPKPAPTTPPGVTPTRTLNLRTSPTPSGRTTDVPIIPPGGAGTPTPIYVGPIPPATGQPVAQPTTGTAPATGVAPLPPPAQTPVSAPVTTAPPAQPAPVASPVTGITYVVKSGDTLSTIALRYGLTTSALAQANGISNVSRIYIGQKLIIPVAAAVTAPKVHIVQRGETLSGIAVKYKTTVAAIVNANKLTNSNLIRVGQRLIIP